jgi:hypothetical protein
MTFDWFVGFYEGEGCPSRTGSRYKNKYYNYLRLAIGQKDKTPLVRIKKFLEDLGYTNVYIYPNRKTYKGRPYLSWILYITMQDAVRLAKEIMPKMQSKAKKTQLQDALKGNFHRA